MHPLKVNLAGVHQEIAEERPDVGPRLGTPAEGVSSTWHSLPLQVTRCLLPLTREAQAGITGVWRAHDKSADDDVIPVNDVIGSVSFH